MPAKPPRTAPATLCDVILDIEVERGALHFVLACCGHAHAHAVRVRFNRVIRDLAGLRVNDNPLFTHLEFLPAGRRVRLFVDTLEGYTRRRQPARFQARIEWLHEDGVHARRTLSHDLAAWSQLRETL